METVSVSGTPIENDYVRRGMIHVDAQLTEPSEDLISALSYRIPGAYITSTGQRPIGGTSWEMAAIMASAGIPGSYSGSVEYSTPGIVHFSPVLGIAEKRALGVFKTSRDIASVPY